MSKEEHDKLLTTVRGTYLQYSKNIQDLINYTKWPDINVVMQKLDSLEKALNHYGAAMYELGKYEGVAEDQDIDSEMFGDEQPSHFNDDGVE